MVLVGSHHTDSGMLQKIKALIEKYEIVSEEWDGYNVLQKHISSTGAFDVGLPARNG